MSRAAVLAAVALLGLGATACTTDSADSVAVVGTNDTCEPAVTSLPAGKVTFEFTNKASDVSELYVLRADDSVAGEVENVTTGTKRTLTADLVAGDYTLVCKPGQQGDGIRTAIEVVGAGGAQVRPADRTVEIGARTYAFEVPDDLAITTGQTITFQLTNKATDLQHEMEVFGPDGTAVGEVGPTDPGATGTVTLSFDTPGTYRFVCGIEGHEAAGMVAGFDITGLDVTGFEVASP